MGLDWAAPTLAVLAAGTAIGGWIASARSAKKTLETTVPSETPSTFSERRVVDGTDISVSVTAPTEERAEQLVKDAISGLEKSHRVVTPNE